MSASTAVLWAALTVFNALLASLILAPRPRQARHILAAILVGFNAIFGARQVYIELTGVDQSTLGNQAVDMVLAIPTFIALAVFALFFPRSRLPPRWERVVLGAAAALVMLDWLLVAFGYLRGELLFTNVHRSPLFALLVFAPFAFGLLAGVVLLLHGYLTTDAAIPRDQMRYVLGAFLLKAGSYLFILPTILGRIRQPHVEGAFGDPFPNTVYNFYTDVGALVLVAVAWVAVPIALVASRLAGRAAGRPWSHDAFLMGCVALGLLFATDFWYVGSGFMLEGEYMLARPLLFTVGILHIQLLGLDIRRHLGQLGATLAAGCLCTLLVVSATAENMGVSPGLAGGIGTVATLLLAGVLGWPIARQLLTPARNDERNREIYRDALEAAAVESSPDPSAQKAVLEVLRSRLRIGESEHELMAAQVRARGGSGGMDLAPGRLFLGRYEVRGLLGEGGFGRTYQAWDRQLARMVVVKESRGESHAEQQRVLKEARVLAATPHPHIVTVYDADAVGDSVFLVLEYVPGGSLRERLGKGPLPWREAAGVLRDMLEGLQAAHSKGIIHRDIKPENVLLTASGKAKLADFGVAKAEAMAGGTEGGSAPGVHPGSLLYMSPEQVRGVPLDARSDLYSAAAVFVEIVTGKPYLHLASRTDFDARVAVLEEPPRLPVKGLPAKLNRLLEEALGKEKEERPADAAEFRRRLDEAAAANVADVVRARR